jgi:hypothetical protein
MMSRNSPSEEVEKTDTVQEYVYRWNRHSRKGQACTMLCRGTLNSCLVKFADGYTMVTSRNAIRKSRSH